MNDLATLALTELAAKAASKHPTMTRTELERIVFEELVTRKQAELENDAKAAKAAQALLDRQRKADAEAAVQAARTAEVEAARVAAEQRAAAVEAQARREALTASHAAAMASHADAVRTMANACCDWLRAYAAIDAGVAAVYRARVDAYAGAGLEGLAEPQSTDPMVAIVEALRAARVEGSHDVWRRALRDLEVATQRA